MAVSLVSQSITQWIRALQDGRSSAFGPLLEAYFDRLVQLARARLRDLPGVVAYDEDVALRSFYSMCLRLRDTQRPLELTSRDDLWRLLATRTIWRVRDLIRQHKSGEAPGEHDVEHLLAREPTPERAAEMADECQRLLGLLDEPVLRQIAVWKVEGWTHKEIAAKLDCVPRTVERKVQRIRLLWQQELKELKP